MRANSATSANSANSANSAFFWRKYLPKKKKKNYDPCVHCRLQVQDSQPMSGVACVTRGGLLLWGGPTDFTPRGCSKKKFFFFPGPGTVPKKR